MIAFVQETSESQETDNWEYWRELLAIMPMAFILLAFFYLIFWPITVLTHPLKKSSQDE